MQLKALLKFKNLPFLLGLLLTLSLLWPLVAAPFFKHHDDVQIIRLYEMDKCFSDFQIPCRWVPDLGGLYGYPLFNYYAPLPYYFGEIIYLLSGSLIISVKIMFTVSFLGSFIFMFLCARKFWTELGASLSAIFYSFAPYHAVNLYVRGAMGEMWGLMFFPAIVWATVRVFEKSSILNMLLLAVFIAALITSHNLSAFIFLPFLLVLIFFLYFKNKIKRFLYYTFSSFIISILLSSFYLIPMVFEKNLVHVETTTVGYFGYTEHFKGLRKLILDRSWGYGPSVREVPGGERDKLSYQIGWIHLIGWILALASAKIFWAKNKWISSLIIFCSAIILINIFLIHPRSEFVWKMIEPLKYLQFPWRLLILIIFFISFISGSIFLSLAKWQWKNALFGVLVVLVVALNFSYFRPEKFLYINDQDLLRGQSWEKQIMRSIYDFLPIFAKEPPADLAPKRYEILTGDSRIYDFEQKSNWLKFKTETYTHTIIRLSQYYFPEWKIFVDGKESKYEYANNSLGLMTLILGKGSHVVEARLYDTPVRTIANLTSAFGFIITSLLFLISFKKIRQWISYYRRGID